VLPFKPLVADQRDEVLEMGIADTLITRLSSLKQVTVLPISAVRGYTKLDQDSIRAGRELAVQALLEGSIQRAGDKIRITARLINIADGKPLWTRQFDEHWTDIFAVQDAISRRVADDLMVTLTGQERSELARNYTTDPEAYQLYLTGRYNWNKRSGEGMHKSIEFFRQAIEKDRNYALAYVGLADAYATLSSYHMSLPGEVVPLAREAAERALNIDPNLAEAHATLGRLFTDYYWEFERAEREFQQAIELKPNYSNAHQWYSSLLMARTGRFDEAVREATRALELDQNSPALGTQLGLVLYRARRYDQGIAVLQKTLEIEPNHIPAHYYLGLCYLMLERRDEALAEFQKCHAIAPNASDIVALPGYIYAQAGNRDEARRYQTELNELAAHGYVSPFSQVVMHAGLGEIDEVFKWLEKAFEVRDSYLRSLNTDPLFDSVRLDPRFALLMRRVGLDQ
jgi:TolB-like protein/tetratricopeptide (TPR) repeat protein